MSQQAIKNLIREYKDYDISTEDHIETMIQNFMNEIVVIFK